MAKISRVLLVNDTRGAQEYLQRAFHSMGLECDMALFGWSTIKPIEHSLNFDPLRGWGALGKVPRPLINLVNVARLKHYDVASYVHRISFVDRPHFLRYLDLPAIRSKVGVMSYTALGCDDIAFIFGNPKLPYKPCATCQAIDDPARYCERVIRPLKERSVAGLNLYFDCAVSTAFEYSHIESLYKRHVARIPLPVDVSEVPWKPSGACKSGKVKILHTPSRGGFKGTAVVLEAIEHLSKMRDDFEFKVITGVPFNQYIELVGAADIIVDQVWSQSPGMNALWLLCMGKIVLSGNTTLAKNYFAFGPESPIVNAEPEPMELVKSLSELISRRASYSSMADAGRDYVMRNHDHMKIANDYLRMWQAVDQP